MIFHRLLICVTFVILEVPEPGTAADCYWRGFPLCGFLVSCSGDDHFMRYGLTAQCLLSPDKYCCPSSGSDVILCQHKDFEGDCISHEVHAGHCVMVDYSDWASSVNTLGKCVTLYQDYGCSGKSVSIQPGTIGHSNLQNVGMNDMVTSVRQCSEYVINLCEHKDFEGDCISHDVGKDECVAVAKRYWASSANTHGKCFNLYDRDDCAGPSISIQPGTTGHSNLRDVDMNDKVLSVSRCSEYTITFCENQHFGGDCISQDIAKDQCVTVVKMNWARSANTHGKCFRLYELDGCMGKSVALQPGTTGHSNLADVGMSENVVSVSRCSEFTMTLCQYKDLTGDCISHDVGEGKCVTVIKRNWANSANTEGNCFRFYDRDDCEGKSVPVQSHKTDYINLEDVGMNNMVRSVSRCFSSDVCLRRSRRSTNGFNCRWADQVLHVGFIDGLPLDTNVTEGGPVVYYQLGPQSRTEVMHAHIFSHHLYSGTPTNDNSRAYARRMGIYNANDRRLNDDAGHILGNVLGGSGTDLRNIFPQSRNINRGVWTEIEDTVRQMVKNVGSAYFTVNLLYRNIRATRPYRLVFHHRAGDTLLGGFSPLQMPNPGLEPDPESEYEYEL